LSARYHKYRGAAAGKDEHAYTGGYTIVKDYVRLRKLSQRETFVPGG